LKKSIADAREMPGSLKDKYPSLQEFFLDVNHMMNELDLNITMHIDNRSGLKCQQVNQRMKADIDKLKKEVLNRNRSVSSSESGEENSQKPKKASKSRKIKNLEA